MRNIEAAVRSTRSLLGLRLKEPLTRESVAAVVAINNDAIDFTVDISVPETPNLIIPGFASRPVVMDAMFDAAGVLRELSCMELRDDENGVMTSYPRALHLKAFETMAFLFETKERVEVSGPSPKALRLNGLATGHESPGGHQYFYETELEATYEGHIIQLLEEEDFYDQTPGDKAIMLALVTMLVEDLLEDESLLEELYVGVFNEYDLEIAEKFGDHAGFDLTMAYPPLFDSELPGRYFVKAVLDSLQPTVR